MGAGHFLELRAVKACLLLLAAWCAVFAVPAAAKAPEPRSHAPECHAYADSRAGLEALRQSDKGWICADRGWRADTRFALLRFDLGPKGTVPDEFSSRLARFETAFIEIERPDGRIDHHPLSSHDFMPRGHMRLAAALPEAGSAARRITIGLVGPTMPTLLSEARLNLRPTPLLGLDQIWVAVLAGVLLVPLFFNLALYRVLRDRFLLWHVAVVGFMLAHTVISTGLVSLIMPIPVGSASLLIAVVFSGGAASAMMLASDFIEPDSLDPHHRQALRIAALWLTFNLAFYAATIDWLQARAATLYLANWLPPISMALWVCNVALRRGSRAAKFLIASWAPLILAGLWQVFDGAFGNFTEPAAMFAAQRVAIGLEVLIASIGVADRFIQLRRDRDDHRVRASELARLAQLDPLTGLLNRRAIEGRFAALRREGFGALAVFDLDHFKAVNDRFGHTVGDHVLQAVAASLPHDRDLMAVRMGGEEFVLLLRGRNALQRAEQIRQAITTRIMRDISGLDAPVTASMGLVEIPAEVMPDASFAAIYARADSLLYQAKSAGRNRLVNERMTVFDQHRKERRARA